MKVLVIGVGGMVGSRFVELSDFDLLTPNHSELDITNLESIKKYFDTHQFDAVINFAAYTNVSEAQKQRDDKNGDCWKINVEGVRNLLQVLLPKTSFVQISTDMAFSGDSGPYAENQAAEVDGSKLTWYGFTKAEAERLIDDRGTIVRIIYPVRAKFDKKLDYLRKPLNLYDQGKLYPLFVDQQINITYIDELCGALQKIINKKLGGTFHVASCDLTTPHELISYYISQSRHIDFSAQAGNVDPQRYPKFGGLKTTRMQFSSWREIVQKLLATV